jgi:hypothetical protein
MAFNFSLSFRTTRSFTVCLHRCPRKAFKHFVLTPFLCNNFCSNNNNTYDDNIYINIVIVSPLLKCRVITASATALPPPFVFLEDPLITIHSIIITLYNNQ